MRFEFTKMEALGNDHVFIDAFRYPQLLPEAKELAVRLCDRHFGIGGDGVIFAAPSEKADLAMRMFNADGSEAEMCGNGIRQLARYAYEKGIAKKDHMIIDTRAGMKTIVLQIGKGDTIDQIQVDMGSPILEPREIPVNAELNNQGFSQKTIEVLDRSFEFTFVSMGNPHAITFLPKVSTFPVEKYGPVIENNTLVFPRRVNVEFIEVLSDTKLQMRVWERGSGETLACGSGTCAAVVAAVLNGLTKRKVDVNLPGGTLNIEWSESGSIIMTGNSVTVFEGESNYSL